MVDTHIFDDDETPSTPTCDRCGVELEYARTTAKPNGYALVYECPRCGATAAYGQTADDETDWRLR